MTRTGATEDDAKAMMAVSQNGAVALLARHAISPNIFESLYEPFAEEAPFSDDPPQDPAQPDPSQEEQGGSSIEAKNQPTDPVLRYSAELVRSACALASDLVSKDSDDILEVEVATEICYYLVQMGQRQVGGVLTDAQMSYVIPKLTFRVFDALVEAYGMADTALSPADLDEFRVGWINQGADRNDFYGQCHLGMGESGSMAGVLNWEAAKIIANVAGVDAIRQMTLSLTLPMIALAMNREDLIRAAN